MRSLITRHLVVFLVCLFSTAWVASGQAGAVCKWLSTGYCVSKPAGPDADRLGDLVDCFNTRNETVNGEPCKSDPDDILYVDPTDPEETCHTVFESPDQRCIPKASSFSSAQEYDALREQIVYCAVQVDFKDPNSMNQEGCKEWRETWYPKMECPECVAYAQAEADARPICLAVKTEAECTPEASGIAPPESDSTESEGVSEDASGSEETAAGVTDVSAAHAYLGPMHWVTAVLMGLLSLSSAII